MPRSNKCHKPVSLKFQFTENGLGANSSKCTFTDIACEPFYYQEMSQFKGNVHLKHLVNRKQILGELEFQWNQYVTQKLVRRTWAHYKAWEVVLLTKDHSPKRKETKTDVGFLQLFPYLSSKWKRIKGSNERFNHKRQVIDVNVKSFFKEYF